MQEPSERMTMTEEMNELPAEHAVTSEPVNGRLLERDEKRVPVSEAVKYRKRAQEAERSNETLQASLDELRSALDESRSMLLASERRRTIDETLAGLHPADLETARVMLEGALQTDAEGEAIREAAKELKRRKPFLFRTPGAAQAGSMGGRPRQKAGTLDTHAKSASETGDRKALMRYLRVRREEGAS